VSLEICNDRFERVACQDRSAIGTSKSFAVRRKNSNATTAISHTETVRNCRSPQNPHGSVKARLVPTMPAPRFAAAFDQEDARRRRVADARLAAARRPLTPLVLAAWRADALRAAAERFRAAVLACFDNCAVDPAERPSRFKARRVARERVADAVRLPPRRPSVNARSAARRVRADVVPFVGGGSSTPARRALESPMAMACFVERAPCLPSRT
jgi:hypothetical protein